jgi:tetratricopeptide (TPR) repeat protein
MPSLDQLLPLLEADPQDSFLRYGVAMEYAKLGRFDDAMREFNELLKNAPDYVAGYFMAGRTCEQMDDLEKAKTYYRDGIAAAKRTGDQHAAGEISAALMMIE